MPKEKTLDYILEPAIAGKQTTSYVAPIVPRVAHVTSTVIYCIDLSGSMCQTQEVQGRMQLKGVQLSNKLAAFTDGSVQCASTALFCDTLC